MKKVSYIALGLIILIALIIIIPKHSDAPRVADQGTTTPATSTATTTIEEKIATSGLLPKNAVVSNIVYYPQQPSARTLATTSATLAMNVTKKVGPLTVTVESIKDTRCPMHTNCNNKGDARVTFAVAGPTTTKNISMIEGQAALIDNVQLKFDNVLPERTKNADIPESQYQFFVSVSYAK